MIAYIKDALHVYILVILEVRPHRLHTVVFGEACLALVAADLPYEHIILGIGYIGIGKQTFFFDLGSLKWPARFSDRFKYPFVCGGFVVYTWNVISSLNIYE